MLLLYALSLLARGFPVLLLFGVLCLLAGRQSKSQGFTVVGWILVGFGALGAVHGVPYYYAAYRHASEARSHFKALCESKAVVSLPARPVLARGVLWSETGQSRASHLASRDHYRDFVGPSQGRYIEIEQPASSGGFDAAVWDDRRGLDLMNDVRPEPRPEPTLPFEVRTRVITTPEDKRYEIEGIETVIVDRSNGQPIARRVVFGRMDRTTPRGAPERDLPSAGDRTGGDCDLSGCTILPFVFAAVRPQVPTDLSKALTPIRWRWPKDVALRLGDDHRSRYQRKAMFSWEYWINRASPAPRSA